MEQKILICIYKNSNERKFYSEPDMVVHACNPVIPAPGRLRQEDGEFEISLRYIA
jgi:hypothetical protein